MLSLNSKHTSAKLLRGNAYRLSADYVNALDDLNAVILEDAKSEWALCYRSTVYLRLGRNEQCFNDISKGIRINPMNLELYKIRISYYISIDLFKEALTDAEKLVKLGDKNPDSYHTRGVVRTAMHEWSKALEDYKEAIRLDPNFARGYEGLAFIYATCPDTNLHNLEMALENSKKACDLSGWRLSSSLETYAASCAAKGDFTEAIKWQRRVVEDLDYVNLQRGMPRIWLKLFEERKAIKL